MSDGITIDFGALRNQAAEMMDAADNAAAVEAPPAAPAAIPAPEAPKVGATPAVDKVETPAVVPDTKVDPAEPKLADLTDDTLVKVTVDGEDVVMPWKDARAGVSRTQKFTKSMQQLAKDRGEIEAAKADLASLQQLRNEREGFNRFLSDPQAVAKYLMDSFPNAFEAPQAQAQQQQQNGDEIITRAEAMRLAEASAAQRAEAVARSFQSQMQDVDARIAEATASLEHKQQTAKHAAVISNTLVDIFTNNPVLKAIPNAEDLIRFEVAQMKPQTEADALEAFRTVAQGMTEEIGKHFTNQKKVQAVAQAKAKLETKTIEPAGGAAPQIQPTSFKNADGSVNWKAVTNAARDAY